MFQLSRIYNLLHHSIYWTIYKRHQQFPPIFWHQFTDQKFLNLINFFHKCWLKLTVWWKQAWKLSAIKGEPNLSILWEVSLFNQIWQKAISSQKAPSNLTKLFLAKKLLLAKKLVLAKKAFLADKTFLAQKPFLAKKPFLTSSPLYHSGQGFPLYLCLKILKNYYINAHWFIFLKCRLVKIHWLLLIH